MSDVKPACPTHPKAGVTDAAITASDKRVWVCLQCGQVVGTAPPREAVWESFTYEAGEQGELTDGS